MTSDPTENRSGNFRNAEANVLMGRAVRAAAMWLLCQNRSVSHRNLMRYGRLRESPHSTRLAPPRRKTSRHEAAVDSSNHNAEESLKITAANFQLFLNQMTKTSMWWTRGNSFSFVELAWSSERGTGCHIDTKKMHTKADLDENAKLLQSLCLQTQKAAGLVTDGQQEMHVDVETATDRDFA